MGARRAEARLCGRDARAPGTQTYPCKPLMGEGLDEGDARKRGFCGRTIRPFANFSPPFGKEESPARSPGFQRMRDWWRRGRVELPVQKTMRLGRLQA